ncbi:ABC transporter C family member 9 [Zea mays]|nr:ABC transporter C family member 9 [Zea mays]
MNPVFSIGYKKPLEKNAVPDVDGKDAAEFLSDSFKNVIDDVEHSYGLSTSSIYRAMFIFIRRKAIINAGFAVLSASASYVGPSLINDLVKFLGGQRQYGLKRGYILAVAFLSAKVVETISQRQWIFGARQLGMRLRAALISHIYQKGLHLSCSSRQKHTSGEIINYMSVDIQRITDVIWYINYIWMLPIQLSLAVYILHTNLGVGAWAGLAATLAIMACNIPLTKMQKRLQAKIMVAKDNRMKATTEVLRSMKILKLQAWDMKYLHKLKTLRGEEYNWLWRSVRLSALTTFIFWGSPAFISSITFGSWILLGVPLTAGTVLSALATFRMLQDLIFTLPDLLSVFAQGKVSADRVAKYLEEEELKCDAVTQVPRNDTDFDVKIDHGIFSWELETTSPTLTDVELKVKRGMKVAICGMVGSGKSSLLSCILGEMPKLDGTVRVSGRKAYVPQTAWILSGNIRENILFGNTHDEEKYKKIIQSCALTKDLELFANGDLTEIGERGINMSGGQKQRIQIARSVYEDADIYLFDDPFSAVDAHTGSQLFKDCVMGILKDKTVLYVTHQVEFLPAADLILVMQDGKIVQKGKFNELLQQNIGFEAIAGAHSQALESVINVECSSRIPPDNKKSADSEDEFDTENEIDDQLQGITKQESTHDVSQDISDKGRLTQEEEREKGGIGKKVYWTYLRAVHGGALVPVTIAAQSFFQIFQVASNYWMAWASPPTTATTPTVGLGLLFSVYIALSMGSALCVLSRSLLVSLIGLLTSEKFFKDMLHCILHAPMSFFDSTPTGRILNRASNDQSVLDLEIANKLGWCVFSIIQILGTIGVMSQVAWPVFAIFVPVTVVCFLCQAKHSIQLCLCLFFDSASIAGLAVTYALNLNSQLASIIWNICNTENKMISVERIMQYSRIPTEAPIIVNHYRPPNSWPDAGTIHISSLEVRYVEHLPSILRNISCTIPGRKKVGIVGRTGSGKSTFIQALFRIVEPRGGTIEIDNVDILKIGLHDLRGRLSIIPQDPTMFEGTVRGNLDPLNEYPDHRVWEILDKCQLGDIVRRNPKKLDSIGRVIEYDTPTKLLENETSEFSKLIKEYSGQSHGFSGTTNN